MTATYVYGTGWETGVMLQGANFISDGGPENPAIQAGGHTGSYHIEIHGGGTPGWLRYDLDTPLADGYYGMWVHPHDAIGQNENMRIQLLTDGAGIIEVRKDSSNYMRLYVNGSLKETGTIAITTWRNIQIHAIISDTGSVEVKVDGITDISWPGDTRLATADTAVDQVRWYGVGSNWWVDDFIIATADWPGDIRFDVLVPNGDTTILDWDPSATGTHYTLIDEIGPSDADYIYTGEDAEKDKFDLGNWVGTDKNPILVNVHLRARKDNTELHQLAALLDDGTEDVETMVDLLQTFAYYTFVWAAPPSGGVWTDAIIDALIAGVESNIV